MTEPMAFPHCFEDCAGARNWIQSSGMTLRDYFAAKAMAVRDMPAWSSTEKERANAYEMWARHCYTMADAMLRAREPRS